MLILQRVWIQGLLIFASTLSIATASQASSIQNNYKVTGPVLNCTDGDSNTSGALIGGSISEADCTVSAGAIGSFVSTATAATGYGTARASASVTYSNLARGTSAARGTARATSRFTDRIVLDVPGRSGEIVDLIFEITLSGGASATIDGVGGGLRAKASGLINARVNGLLITAINSNQFPGDGALSNNGPGQVSITFGEEFLVDVTLIATAELDDFGNTGIRDVNGFASAAFGNSGGISSFALIDGEGLTITDFTMSSESSQFELYTPIPEPSSALLLGLGLALMRVGSRRHL